MVAPHELKIPEFSKVLRGYNPQEVDAQIEFLKMNCGELYERIIELEKAYDELYVKYKEATLDKDAVKHDLLDAQQAGQQIIAEAEEKADIVVRATKTNCDYIINDFRRVVSEERDKLFAIQAKIQSFKDVLLEECRDYMDKIEELTEIADTTLYYSSDDELVARAIDEAKTDVRYAMVEKEQLDTISDDEAKVDLDCFNEVPVEEEKDEMSQTEIYDPENLEETDPAFAKTVMIPDETANRIGDKYMEFLEGLAKDNSDTDKE